MRRKWMLFLLLLLLFVQSEKVMAATLPVLPTDVSAASKSCVLLGIEGTYIVQIQASLDRINEIRYEACQEGVLNPNTGKKLTLKDYVPIKWSSDLEYIARIRAAEASVTMNHIRTNGSNWYELSSPGGVSSYTEVLAWNWSQTMLLGINQWYTEKADWVNQSKNAVTGHYTALINPDYRYVGLGVFYSTKTKYPNTTAGEFSKSKKLDETKGKAVKNCVQTLEVNCSYISSYSLKGDTSGKCKKSYQLTLLANVKLNDYWGRSLATTGLQVLGNMKWSSSNTSVASISSKGVLSAKTGGKVTIAATDPKGKAAKMSFTVNHTKVVDKAVAATCTKAGSTQGQHCSGCGKVFTASSKIAALGHSYKTTVTKNSDGKTGKIVKKCSRCGKTVSETFKLVPTGTSISSLKAVSGGFTVKWKKQASQTTGYQIQYSTSSKFTNAKTITISKNTTVSRTVSKLKAKKKYYVRIRTYKTAGGTNYYSAWSASRTVTVK